MSEKGISKKLVLWIVIISVLLLAIVILSFLSFFKKREDMVKEKDSGVVLLTYSTEDSSMSITKLTPTKDEDGIKMSNKNEYFDFTVKTKLEDSSSIEYEVSLEPNTKDTNILSNIKVYLERQNNGAYVKLFEPKKFVPIKEKTAYGSRAGSMILINAVKESDSIDNYRLRIWIDEKANLTEENIKDLSFSVYVLGKANGD